MELYNGIHTPVNLCAACHAPLTTADPKSHVVLEGCLRRRASPELYRVKLGFCLACWREDRGDDAPMDVRLKAHMDALLRPDIDRVIAAGPYVAGRPRKLAPQV